MKKLLLSTAAVGLAFAAMPAHADIDLDVGGYFKGYGAFVDQNEVEAQTNNFDFLKDTELHFTGETTLDNGLTVGAHVEFHVDGADDADIIDESYAYFSGSWGRVNFGEEDGAAYLLQVAAPSADKNVDGLRTYIQPVNGNAITSVAVTALDGAAAELEYDLALSAKDTKLTYLSPVVNGFQVGVSYAPDDGNATGDQGVGTDNQQDTFGASYDVAARYEGEFEGVGVTLGAGYAKQDLQAANAVIAAGEATDDRAAWNVGLDLNIGPVGVGAAYKEDDNGEISTAGTTTAKVDDEKTFVVGVDYTTGPFKLGASYYDASNLNGSQDLDAQRYTGGVVYTYGPGMTLRGSVSYVEFDQNAIGGGAVNSVDATSFLVGTQVKF